MPVPFPICFLVFLAGWLSGSLFILVSLDPNALPALLSPLDSKFTDLEMQLRRKKTFLADSSVNEESQHISSSSFVSEVGLNGRNTVWGKRDFHNNELLPTNITTQSFFGGLSQEEIQYAPRIFQLSKFP